MQNKIGQKNTLSQFICSGNDGVLLNISKDDVPDFFIQAHQYIQTGEIGKANTLLDVKAVESVRQIAKKSPSKANAMYLMIATMFQKTGRLDEAEKFYRKILKKETNSWVLNELANICQHNKRLTEALEYRKKALELMPDDAGILTNLALDSMLTGKVAEGVGILKTVLEKTPAGKSARSSYLWYMHYPIEQNPQNSLEEHKKWGQMYAPMSLAKTSYENIPEPGRKLRIGYISPDFYNSSTARNFDAFLSGRNSEEVEVYGYGNVARPDEFTEHFKKNFDYYRNIRGVNDETAAKIIEQDNIDILVEVGGYVKDNRMGVLAYKPAPIQVDYGGISTTGMEQIDYRFTDSILDTPAMRKFYIEESIDLQGGLFCYKPAENSPAITPLPAKKNGFITFGSFNNNLKITPYIMEIWARVLKANKKSRLLLKFGSASDKHVRQRYLQMFEDMGIRQERIDIYGWMSAEEHMKLYCQVDIALDTYPYNGTVTTLEGMWMGVPVITLFGENSLLSRAGLSILSRLDMEFFAASTPDEFVRKATAFASNLDALAKIRASMRQRMTASTLCNPKAYASSLEAAYRKMWRKWCEKQKSDVRNQMSDFLASKDGRIQLKIPANYVPCEFIKAEEYIAKGKIKEAANIIDTEAIEKINQIVLREPDKAAVMYFVLAAMLQKVTRFSEAEEFYKKALKQQPNALVFNELAEMYQTAEFPSKAMQYRKKALELAPDDEYILNRFALDLMQMGQIEKGVELLMQIMEKSPDNKKFRADYLWNTHYLSELDPEVIFEEHRKWARIHAPMSLAKMSHDNDPDPERRLRVGYISPDFPVNSSAINFNDFLAGRDTLKVEVFGYANIASPDELTENFKKTFDYYRCTKGIKGEDVAALIVNDKIDILVSMGGGHETPNRYDVLAYKPAPIQVDYGAINTTGMEQVDYRFSDEWQSPSYLHKYYVEETICLSGGFYRYNAQGCSPDIAGLAALKNGYVTFGSFNNNRKINEQVIKLWSRVLHANAGSRLILKFKGGNDRQIKDYYLEQFEKFGIEKKRIEICGQKTIIGHLELFGQIDIALDTFPFNGCMTTLDGLWMGVPVVSMVGEKHLLSRCGLSILTQTGLEFFAASNPDEFVKKATAFASNLDALAKIRASMRQRMAASTLCNPKAYASSLEAAYRKMWRKWCEKQKSEANKTEQKESLSQFLFSNNGELQFQMPEGGIPEFLVKVIRHVKAGETKEAAILLQELSNNAVEKMVEKDSSKKSIIYLLLALMFQHTGQARRAENWYKKILELESNALVLNELANICRLTKRLTEAMQYRKRALELTPDDVGIQNNYALDMMRTGRIKQGVEMLEEVLRKAPTSKLVRSCYLWHLHYLPNIDPAKTFGEHKKWGQMHSPMSLAKTSHDNVPEPDRKLRVGYLSADFRMHSVAYNFDAFLEGCDRQAVEVYGYGNVASPDEFTEHFKKSFDCYRNIYGTADEAVAEIVESDKIDILVHIGGHTADNSLGVLTYKPAPIQVDYGGINTTGMEQVDYRFTDEQLDLPALRKYYLEESVCLTTGLFCYKPSPFASPIEPLAARQNGYITFGSFNMNIKINPYILSIWAKVLIANENSHLILKFAGADDKGVKEYYLSQFEHFGIERERIEFYDWLKATEHLKLYGQIDIALDTYPFNGCMTTLEGMWMGVPTVSLIGEDSLLSRVGLSILSRVGLEFFATKTADEFVKKATAFAHNLDALEKIRFSMRQRMTASTLCNPKAYAQSVESAYRKMWHKWCEKQKNAWVKSPSYESV